MTLQELQGLQDFRDEVVALFPDTFGWDFYTTSTPDDYFLCAKGHVLGLSVRLSYCADLIYPYDAEVGGVKGVATTLKQALFNAVANADEAAAEIRKALVSDE